MEENEIMKWWNEPKNNPLMRLIRQGQLVDRYYFNSIPGYLKNCQIEYIYKCEHSPKSISEIQQHIVIEWGEINFESIIKTEIEKGDYETAKTLMDEVTKSYIQQYIDRDEKGK